MQTAVLPHPALNTWRGGINLAWELHAPAPCHNMLLTQTEAIALDCSEQYFIRGQWFDISYV